MRVALDTNVLAYAEGVGDAARQGASLDLLGRLADGQVLLPAQTLGELYRVLVGKAGRDPALAREAVLGWADCFEVADSTCGAFQSAMDLCAAHGLQFWDALILSVAAESRCRFLLSEDLQSGFTWRGVVVVNPFAPEKHPLLASLLSSR